MDVIHRAKEAKEAKKHTHCCVGRKAGDAKRHDGHVETEENYVHMRKERYGTWDRQADLPLRTPLGCAPPP